MKEQEIGTLRKTKKPQILSNLKKGNFFRTSYQFFKDWDERSDDERESLEKKYGLNFDTGKIKTSMFLSDLQRMGRIQNIYGDGTVVLSILRYRMQDYEPMDEVSVFYNSKSLADSIMTTYSEKELKEDDL